MRHLVVLLLLVVTPLYSKAQNTGGVFGPGVNEGHKSLQYRIAYDDSLEAYAHRLHYQQAVNGDTMWRVVAQQRENARGEYKHDFVQLELFQQLPDVSASWQTGVRFDLKLSDSGRPNVVGVNWMNDVQLNDRWMARLLVLTAAQFGENHVSGVSLQTRGSLNYSYSARVLLSVSMFNSYGLLKDIQGFDEQQHQIGPTVQVFWGEGWHLQGGYLAGITDRTPDHTIRFWLTKSF